MTRTQPLPSLLLVACSGAFAPEPAPAPEVIAPTPGATLSPPAAVGGDGTCVGMWQLAVGRPLRSTCGAAGPPGGTVIVDVEGGRYRARRPDGRRFEIRAASSLAAPCALTLRDFWRVEDESAETVWEIGPTAGRGTHRDLGSWTACELEFDAVVSRRDLTAADLAFDGAQAANEVRAAWDVACLLRGASPPPGTGPVPVEIRVDSEGRVDRVVVAGAPVEVDVHCSHYAVRRGCGCLAIPNPSGEAQTLIVPLERTPAPGTGPRERG